MLKIKSIFVAVVISVSLFTTSLAMASKVAFVEVPRLLQEAPQVASVRNKLKKEFARRDDELVAQQQQLKKLADKLKRDASIMSESEVKKLEKDIISRRRKLKNTQTEFQEDLTLRQNEELGKLRKVIAEIIIKVAKEEKIDVVLESGVVWANDASNITAKVLKKLQSLK